MVTVSFTERCPGKEAQESSSRRPDILLVVIDALRADRLGCYGNSNNLIPSLDRLASESVLFKNAVSQAPWTQPSMATLFAAVYPGVHRVLDYNQMIDATYFGARKVAVFSPTHQTLAEILKENGYETAGFVANPFLSKAFGFAQGFDHYDDGFATTSTPGDRVNEAFFQWWERRKSPVKPFFAYLHYMDVHGPYNAGPDILDPMLNDLESHSNRTRLSPEALFKLDYLRRPPANSSDPERHVRLMRYREYWITRYDACVREMDRHLHALFDRLRRDGSFESLLLIVTADHGEELYENGNWDHGHSLHHPALHVPLLLSWPGQLPSGTRIEPVVGLIDLMPTILDLLQMESSSPVQGRSLVPLWKNRDHSAEAPSFLLGEGVKVGPEQKCVYAGRWKLILEEESGQSQLYDFLKDPEERQDLSTKYPDIVRERKKEIGTQQRINKSLSEGFTADEKAVDPEMLKRFRALGYLQ